MSRGRKALLVRVPDELIEAVKEALAARNRRMGRQDFTLSDWIRAAIVEKLDKRRRGQGKGGCITPAKAYYARQRELPMPD